MTRLIQLLFVFLMVAGNAFGSENIQNKNLNCAPRFQAFASFFNLPAHKDRVIEQSWAQLSVKPQFLEFLEDRKIDINRVSLRDREEILEKYHDEFFKAYQSPELLNQEQDRALAQALTLRGAAAMPGQGRSKLKEVSQRNLERIFSGRPNPNITSEEYRELKNLADQVEVYFVHNTNILKGAPTDPVLSSRRLEKYGFAGGKNTHSFNKRLMETDDEVYFLVKFRKKGDSRVASPSSYGKTQLLLDSNYAKKAGMISHFVMYPHELLEFGAIYFPDQFKDLYRTYEETLTMPKKVTPAILADLRGQLSLSDFTVEDFEALTKKYLIEALARWKVTRPQRFKQFIEGDALPQRFDEWMREDVFGTRGISTHWELKIPVAVPSETLKVVEKK